jgi:hypothetical protein
MTGEVHTGFWCGDVRNRPLGRPKRRWEDNGYTGSGMAGMDLIDLVQDNNR